LTYRILLHPEAQRSLNKLQPSIQRRIKDALRELETEPEKGEHLKPSRFLSLRIGDYRAIYEIDGEQNRVIVLYVGHRRNVYDEFSRLV